jgi:hypothetical protein
MPADLPERNELSNPGLLLAGRFIDVAGRS